MATDNLIVHRSVLEIDSNCIYKADQEGDEEGMGSQDAAELKVKVEMEKEILICR